MQLIFILLSAIGILIWVRSKNKSQKKDKRFKSVKQVSNEKNHIELAIGQVIDHIDLDFQTGIINHNKMVVKCIYAGIRSTKNQKIWILAQYLAVIPFAIFGVLGVQFMVGDDIVKIIMGGVAGAALGFYYPNIRIDSMIKERQIEIEKMFPDFVDVLLVCVEAGMPSDQAYVKIIEEFKGVSIIMAQEVELLLNEITYFLDPKIAYDNLYQRTQNEYVKAFSGVVLQSLQYGTPLAQGLRLLSEEIREAQMGKIEKQAAALSSKLTVPMMIFTLPVLFVVIGYPAAMQVIKSM